MNSIKGMFFALTCIIALTACGAGNPNSGGATSAPTAESPRVEAEQPWAGAADSGAPQYSSSDYDGEYNIYPDEEYLEIRENNETLTAENPLSTFSLKVDSASYRNVVRYIESGNLPPHDAVRTEEMINYFSYDEEPEATDSPFSIYSEIGPSPFDESKHLAFVRVKARDIDKDLLPGSNLTFLIDTSGSMGSYDKLPLLKSALGMLVETLNENDVVSIVTYSGKSTVLLDSVRGNQQGKILSAIDKLKASGSTAGGEGIMTAYALAEKNFGGTSNNRVILATDGDFNVGVSDVGELERLIRSKRETGVYLTILGFGTENLKDNKMETLAKNGNGNYHYIDTAYTAKKVLVDELTSNLFTIADDLKAQLEFNPNLVQSYRLIGYENSTMSNRDFSNDKKDAGEIGVGSDVVLLYELLLDDNAYQELKYQNATAEPFSDELFEVRIRYKNPGESVSNLITYPVTLDKMPTQNTSDFNFAASVAGFGHMLRDLEYTVNVDIEGLLRMARDNTGIDKGGHRKEFVTVLENYARIIGR